jgi:hypothetical protein
MAVRGKGKDGIINYFVIIPSCETDEAYSWDL